MNLKQYLATMAPEERENYAKRSGTTVAYLIQIAGGHRRAGTDLAKALARESEGQVPLSELRPDVWEAA